MSDGKRYVGRTFLRGLAALCGAPNNDVSTGHLRVIADEHDVTLVGECGVDTSEVLRRVIDVFEKVEDGGSGDARESDAGSQATFHCLGATWGALSPGVLDQLYPAAPALLHYPTRQGLPVANPNDGDTMIPLDEIVMLVGQGAAGKSMFFLLLAISIASGIPFLGKWPVGHSAALRPAVLVCAEDRREQIIRRLQLISRRLLADLLPEERRRVESRIYIVALAGVTNERILLQTVDGVPIPSSSFHEFASSIKRIKPALVGLDPLSRLLSGNVDLSSEVGTAWVAMLESIVGSATEPISVWFAHHSNKASRRAKIRTEDEEPEARGTSGLFDAVRVECYLASQPDSQVAFRVRKNNHGPTMAFKDREILIRGDHGILRTATPDELKDREEAATREMVRLRDEDDSDTERRLLVALALNPNITSRETLRSIIGRGKAPFDRAFGGLLGSRDGRPPMVSQQRRGDPFVLHGVAVAQVFPDLVDRDCDVVMVGRLCCDDWPKAIRNPEASVALVAGSPDDRTQSDRTRESGARGKSGRAEGGKGAASGTSTTSRLDSPKGGTQSGPVRGRLRTPPSHPRLPMRDSRSDSESGQSPLAVQSARRHSHQEAA